MKLDKCLVPAGALVSCLLLAIVLSRLDWTSFVAALSGVSFYWVGLSALVLALATSLRAMRWIFLAGLSLRYFRHFWLATQLGYMGNTIYPARAGEVMRVIAVQRSTRISPGLALASSVADRMADLLMLVLFASLLTAVHGAGIFNPKLLTFFVCFFLSVAVLLVLLGGWGERWRPWVERLARCLPRSVGRYLPEGYARMLEVLKNLGQPKSLFAVSVVNFMIFMTDYLAIYLVMSAFGWNLGILSAITVGVFLVAGTALPSVPGYVGIYQVACILALKIYRVEESVAIAFSCVLQVATLSVTGILGGYAFWLFIREKRITAQD